MRECVEFSAAMPVAFAMQALGIRRLGGSR
jgi:hypothetical protein